MSDCRGKQNHLDALSIVEFLVNEGGSTTKTNEEIVVALGWMKNMGGGHHQVDIPRFVQARTHIIEGNIAGGPCTGYRVHFRQSGRGRNNELNLIDPTGSLGPHAKVAISNAAGWLSRESQHKTENKRAVEMWDRLADHALSRGDRDGYRLCTRASLEIDRDGSVTSATMGDLNVWLASLS